MALQPGDRFGRYELVSWLGRGGMAETWRARLVGDAGVTKPVLIKKVLPEYANDEAFISMFISEARISASMSHGNVAQVFDFGRVDGEYFLAMEFVDGQPLNRLLKRALKSGLPALPIPLATFIALEMCRGLHYAHTRTDSQGAPLGLVHRDISPDNVLVSYEGQVKIVDFGIAKARSLRNFKTEPGVVKGKYLFFSPEQARGHEVDARTDVWATGVVLYELLCGQMPVMGPAHVVMMRMAQGDFPSPRQVRKELPAALEEIVMRALAVSLDHRYESSHAFADALAGFLYSFAPRFSSMNLAHLVRELFRGDLSQEGREMAVPPSFQEELQAWRGMGTAPAQPAPPKTARDEVPPRTAPGTTRKVAPALPSGTEEPTAPEAREPPARQGLGPWWPVGVAGLLGLGFLSMLWLPGLMAAEVSDPSPLRPLQGSELKPAERSAPAATKQASASPDRATPTPSEEVRTEVTPQVSPPAAPAVQAPPAVVPDAKTLAEVQSLLEDARKAMKREPRIALELTRHCLELVPDHPECLLSTGDAHARLGQTYERDLYYRRLVELHPGHPRAVELRASLPNTARGQVQASTPNADFEEGRRRIKSAPLQAISLFKRCLEQVPDHPECLMYLGGSYARTGEPDDAAFYYRRFVQKYPEHPKAATVRAILEDYDKAYRQ
jgi:serine/threonine-protein kinase